MKLPLLPVLLFVSGACAPAMAQGEGSLDIDRILEQQRDIRDDIEAREGRYADMPADARRDLLGRQRELTEFLEGKQADGGRMNDSERVYAFNTLEWISAKINSEDDERMVCKRERTLGSNRLTRVCRTVAQMRAEQEFARDQMLRETR